MITKGKSWEFWTHELEGPVGKSSKHELWLALTKKKVMEGYNSEKNIDSPMDKKRAEKNLPDL